MYKSYAITVRPRNGLSDSTMAALAKWCKDQDYASMCIEMEGEARHTHIQVWFDDPRERGVVCRCMQRICERTINDWDRAQCKVLRAGVKICYSNWIEDYCTDNMNKPDPPKIVYEKIPSHCLEYYPSDEEQAAVKARNNAVDKRYHRLSELWSNYWYGGPFLPKDIAEFLMTAEFVDKSICVMKDNKVRRETCLHLYYYISEHAPIEIYH